MKAFFFLALLALAAAASVASERCANGDGSYEPCEEQQTQMPMGSCREYLRQQHCTPWKWEADSCQALRQQCCHQLSQIPRRFRCSAVCRAFRDVRGGLLGSPELGKLGRTRQVAKSLPSLCNMYPSYCNVPTSGAC